MQSIVYIINSQPEHQCFQERLDIGPAYLATPTQRLASTATYTNLPPPPPRSNTLPPSARVALSKNIKQVSEEIIDYCKTESGKKTQCRLLWKVLNLLN